MTPLVAPHLCRSCKKVHMNLLRCSGFFNMTARSLFLFYFKSLAMRCTMYCMQGTQPREANSMIICIGFVGLGNDGRPCPSGVVENITFQRTLHNACLGSCPKGGIHTTDPYGKKAKEAKQTWPPIRMKIKRKRRLILIGVWLALGAKILLTISTLAIYSASH